MTSPPIQKERSLPASCRFAQWLLYLSIMFFLLATAAIGTHLFFFSPRFESAAVAMKVFSLSEVALWPAGSPERNPETVLPGVDLRLIPMAEIKP